MTLMEVINTAHKEADRPRLIETWERYHALRRVLLQIGVDPVVWKGCDPGVPRNEMWWERFRTLPESGKVPPPPEVRFYLARHGDNRLPTYLDREVSFDTLVSLIEVLLNMDHPHAEAIATLWMME